MSFLEVKYRRWFKGIPPKPIKLQIPGWAGDSKDYKDGAKPQPWHCLPFLEAATYSLELLYPFDTEVIVRNVDGRAVFDGDFSKEMPPNGTKFPPFLQFAPGHYGFTSSLDIQAPTGHIIRLEPHPRYYADETGTVPLCVPGHIQSEWWPKIFFVVFKSPRPGDTHIFRKGEPYAQILILPKRVAYDIKEMTAAEQLARNERDAKISQHHSKVARHSWHDHENNLFDDKYKVLAGVFAKSGVEGVDRYLDDVVDGVCIEKKEKEMHARRRLKRRLVRSKNETLCHQEKTDEPQTVNPGNQGELPEG